jgi:cysteinyl-tRNA synthetase
MSVMRKPVTIHGTDLLFPHHLTSWNQSQSRNYEVGKVNLKLWLARQGAKLQRELLLAEEGFKKMSFSSPLGLHHGGVYVVVLPSCWLPVGNATL